MTTCTTDPTIDCLPVPVESATPPPTNTRVTTCDQAIPIRNDCNGRTPESVLPTQPKRGIDGPWTATQTATQPTSQIFNSASVDTPETTTTSTTTTAYHSTATVPNSPLSALPATGSDLGIVLALAISCLFVGWRCRKVGINA